MTEHGANRGEFRFAGLLEKSRQHVKLYVYDRPSGTKTLEWPTVSHNFSIKWEPFIEPEV